MRHWPYVSGYNESKSAPIFEDNVPRARCPLCRELVIVRVDMKAMQKTATQPVVDALEQHIRKDCVAKHRVS